VDSLPIAGVFVALGLALALGLLVGLQRERTHADLGGIRTFPLITLAGVLAGLLATWVVAAALLGLVALLVTGNLLRIRSPEPDAGLTTEVAAVVMFLVGATLARGAYAPAVVTGGLVAVLLYYKGPLHSFVARLGEADVRGVFQIALIGLVVLPVLPDQSFGPYEVLNPYRIWLVVVLIVGISLASYVVYRVAGTRAGTILGGILGGLISSTATTVSYARRTQGSEALAGVSAVVLMIASTVVFGRILFEVGVVAPAQLRDIAAPLGAMAAVNVGICIVGWLLYRTSDVAVPEQENPAEVRAAIAFGLLYGAVLLAVAWTRDYFGEAGLYVVALVSGLTDVDAITLSTAELMRSGGVEASTGWRVMLLGALSNLAFKGGLAGVIGGAALFRHVAALFGASLLAGLAILFLWP